MNLIKFAGIIILTCPDCGGEAIILVRSRTSKYKFPYVVQCQNYDSMKCGCAIADSSLRRAVERWNHYAAQERLKKEAKKKSRPKRTYKYEVSLTLRKKVEVKAETLADAYSIAKASSARYEEQLLEDGNDVTHDKVAFRTIFEDRK